MTSKAKYITLLSFRDQKNNIKLNAFLRHIIYNITFCDNKNIILLTDKNQSSVSSIDFFQMTTKMSEHASHFTF